MSKAEEKAKISKGLYAFSLKHTTKRAVKDFAFYNDTNQSAVVETAIIEYLKRNGKAK